MPCPDDDTISEYLLRRLDDAASAEAERHLRDCSACRALADAAALLEDDPPEISSSAPDAPVAPAAPATSFQLGAGRAVGRYVIVRAIGAGAHGVVYAAHDPKLDRPIALKVLRPALMDPDDAVYLRQLREAKAMARVTHPNVVTVFDVVLHSTGVMAPRGSMWVQVAIAMELIDGASLDKLAAAQPWQRRAALLVCAGRGLAAAHARGLVHRDFKPSNVLVGPDDRVCVTDFGLAAAQGENAPADGVTRSPDATATGALVGTPAYMAPEVFAGAKPSTRSDQYSFGVSLFECVYGCRPFDARDVASLSRAVTSGEPPRTPPRPDVPEALRRLVARALAPAPADRFPDLASLLAELQAALAAPGAQPTVRAR